MEPVYYTLLETDFGNIGIVWRSTGRGLTVVRIVLVPSGEKSGSLIKRAFPEAVLRSSREIDELCRTIRHWRTKADVALPRRILDMKPGTEFQKKVLRETMNIPRGRVSTYGRLAERSRAEGGARAVGNVMATNPYPLLIPCHRVIRSDRTLGGFGGGLKMKKTLLSLEGVAFDTKGRVYPEFIY
jgi:methylated-DNA-[protein]-cysteine S-methyltransferase